MISTNSLSAFAHDVARTGTTAPVRTLRETTGITAPLGATSVGAGIGQVLEAVPAMPNRPMPRGSLLDLKV